MAEIFNEKEKPEWIKHIINSDRILIGIGDLAHATGVAATKLRYWTEKEYIHTANHDNGNHKYTYDTVFKVRAIQSYLDDGFTLAAAVKHMAEHRALIHTLKQVVTDRVQNVSNDGENNIIDFGVFDPDPRYRLTAKITESGTKFELIDKDA